MVHLKSDSLDMKEPEIIILCSLSMRENVTDIV